MISAGTFHPWLHHVVEVGQYGLALEDMAGMLADSTIAITDSGEFEHGPARWPAVK